MRIPHPPTQQGHNAWKQDFQPPPARGDASPIDVNQLVEIHARGFVFENDPCGRIEEIAGVGGGIFYASTPLGSPAARASARRETLHLKTLHRIIDNSEGLDHVDVSPGDLMSDCETLSEQVIRWLFIRACTDQVTYRPFGNQGYSLEFSIG